MNYQKLMEKNPTELGSFLNSKLQKVYFYEHPIYGDESEIIVVSHDKKVASYSGFFDLEDMTATHGEYEPWFDDANNYCIGNL
jgi:hypothetical protein